MFFWLLLTIEALFRKVDPWPCALPDARRFVPAPEPAFVSSSSNVRIRDVYLDCGFLSFTTFFRKLNYLSSASDSLLPEDDEEFALFFFLLC